MLNVYHENDKYCDYFLFFAEKTVSSFQPAKSSQVLPQKYHFINPVMSACQKSMKTPISLYRVNQILLVIFFFPF